MYVDDVATSFHTTEEGLEFYFESKKCLKEVLLNCGIGMLIIKN